MPGALALGLRLGHRMGGAWTPKKLSGCKLWLRSDLGVTAASSNIARWVDLSGNENNVGQDTDANRPSLSTTALLFDGAAEYLTRSVLSSLNGAYTFGIAFQVATPATGAIQVLTGNGTGANGVHLACWSAAQRVTWHPGAASPTPVWGNTTASPETWVARHDGIGTADFCLNGSHQAPIAQGVNAAPTAGFGVGGTYLGGFPAGAKIWAIVAYSARLSAADTLLLDTYLTARRNGTTPTAWRPSDVANLVLWLEQPDLYAGPAVSAWADQSGNGRNVAQGTAAKQPAAIPALGPNSTPALHFDGVNDYLKGTWTQAQPVHLFAVLKHSRVAANGKWSVDGGTGGQRGVTSYSAGRLGISAGPAKVVYVTAPLDAWHRVDGRFNGASSTHRVDDLTPVTGDASTGAGNGLTVGAYGGGAANWADCEVAEIVECDAIQSAANIAKWHAYATARYGI